MQDFILLILSADQMRIVMPCHVRSIMTIIQIIDIQTQILELTSYDPAPQLPLIKTWELKTCIILPSHFEKLGTLQTMKSHHEYFQAIYIAYLLYFCYFRVSSMHQQMALMQQALCPLFLNNSSQTPHTLLQNAIISILAHLQDILTTLNSISPHFQSKRTRCHPTARDNGGGCHLWVITA